MPADDQTALWKSKEDVYRLISTKMTPLPGLLDFLDRCRSNGLAMILVTNAPRLDAVHTLEVLNLSDRYAGVWGTAVAPLGDEDLCTTRGVVRCDSMTGRLFGRETSARQPGRVSCPAILQRVVFGAGMPRFRRQLQPQALSVEMFLSRRFSCNGRPVCWSSCCRPLHKSRASALRIIPIRGRFSQLFPLAR